MIKNMKFLVSILLLIVAVNLPQINGSPTAHNLALTIYKTPLGQQDFVGSSHSLQHRIVPQNFYNYEKQQKQRELVQEFMQNKDELKEEGIDKLKMQNLHIRMKKLIEKSEQIYQIYPMVATSTREEYLKFAKKLFKIVHTDKQGGDTELARKLGGWTMQIKEDFDRLKKQALFAAEQDVDEEPMNLTMADEFIEKMVESLRLYEKAHPLEEILENEFTFLAEIEADLGKFGPIFARNLRMFEADFFQALFLNFDFGQINEEFEEMLKGKMRVAAVFLLGRCYAQKFEAFGFASEYALRALEFHQFYGGHKKPSLNDEKEEKDARWRADVQIGKFYKKYSDFFNAKLQLIAEEMAKKMPKNVKIIDEKINQRSAGNGQNEIAREIGHLLFDKFSSEEICCEFEEDEKGENPQNWMVFNFNEMRGVGKEEEANELLTLTMADKFIAKMKEMLTFYEENEKAYEKMSKHKFNFAEKMQREFDGGKFSKIFSQNLEKFHEKMFPQMDAIFDLKTDYGLEKVKQNKRRQLDELKAQISAAAVHLIGICYANKFISAPEEVILEGSEYANKFINPLYGQNVHASSQVEAIMDRRKFYGRHHFHHKKMKASKDFGQFYWAEYMAFFHEKLLKIAYEMAKIVQFFVKDFDKINEKLYPGKYLIDFAHIEISRHLFDQNSHLCQIKEGIDEGENPEEWSVFAGSQKGFHISNYFGKHKKKNA